MTPVDPHWKTSRKDELYVGLGALKGTNGALKELIYYMRKSIYQFVFVLFS